MDEIVKRAMAKWPNVPDCYGWLGLDRRGHWFLRDDQTQAQGPFSLSKGERLQHTGLMDYIGRNYAKNDKGCWFFQNGPQRVYVELECTPFIWRVQLEKEQSASVYSHTGLKAQVQNTFLDENGLFYLETDLGFGLVHSLDMWAVGECVNAAWWTPKEVLVKHLPGQFGYVQSPLGTP